jgi:hypothetical protein
VGFLARDSGTGPVGTRRSIRGLFASSVGTTEHARGSGCNSLRRVGNCQEHGLLQCRLCQVAVLFQNDPYDLEVRLPQIRRKSHRGLFPSDSMNYSVLLALVMLWVTEQDAREFKGDEGEMRYLLPDDLFGSSRVALGTLAPEVGGVPSWEAIIPRGALRSYGGSDEGPPTGTGTTGTNRTAAAGSEGAPICHAIKGSK